MISTKILNALVQTGALAFVVPVVLIAIWKMRTRKSLIPFFIGALVFVFFARGLESIPHTFFVLADNPISRVIKGHVFLYALYGGLMAGIFEEMGRYVAFRYLLKKHTPKETAVTYGIGHGSMECILILGVGYIQYFFYAQLLNNGTLQKTIDSYAGNAQAQSALQSIVDSLKEITILHCWMAGWERVSAMMLQIALSILIFQAVRVPGKKYMLWVGIGLHALADIPAGFYQAGKLELVTAECIIFILSLVILAYSILVYRNMELEEEDQKEEERKNRQHELHQMARQRFKEKD